MTEVTAAAAAGRRADPATRHTGSPGAGRFWQKAPMAGKVLIGVSGWRYTPWRGHFYPKGLAQWRELEHASRVFPSLELNGSF